MSKVSILIAAYNVSKYIADALDSAVSQTLRDIEIICVDDGSTDNTLSILESYAQADSRIKIIRHKENCGLSKTRYDGLQAASSDYIMFLDGDDCLAPQACEKAYTAAVGSGVDIVQFNFSFHEESPVTPDVLEALKKGCTPCAEPLPTVRGALVDECLVARRFSWNLCGKLFRTEVLLSAYQFYSGERITMAEDLLFTTMALVHASGYKAIGDALYCYRIGCGSSTTLSVSLNKLSLYAEEYQVYALLKNWLECLDAADRYKEAFSFVKQTVYNDAALAFLERLDVSDCDAGLAVLQQYWPAEELAVALAQGVYCAHLATPAQAAVRCRGLKANKRVKQIKTVGTFYYRLYNGGIERVISLLSPIWQQQGYRVVVLTEEISPEDYPLPENVTRVQLPPLELYDELEPTEVEKHVRTLFECIHTCGLDVIVSHAWVSRNQFLDQLVAACAGIPYILHTHGPAPLELSATLDEYFMQAATHSATHCLCDAVIALSEVDKAWWQAMGLRSVAVMNPPTFHVEDITPSALEGHDVLLIGRLEPQKEIYEAFKIAELVHEAVPDMRLRVVGSAPSQEEEEKIRSFLQKNGLSEYVILEGFQSNVAPFFQSTSVLLWTASFEGAPMAMVEGKAFGLPLVTYDLINVDMVRQRKGMIVVPQKAAREAASHVIDLLLNVEKRRELGRQARESAEEMDAVDLGKVWDDIFALALAPYQPVSATEVKPPLEAALEIALVRMLEGQQSRQKAFNDMNNYCSDLQDAVKWWEGQHKLRLAEIDQLQQQAVQYNVSIEQLQQQAVQYNVSIEQLKQQSSQYAISIDRLTHSHIFLAGRVVTWPFRKLKALLRRGKALLSRPKSAVH